MDLTAPREDEEARRDFARRRYRHSVLLCRLNREALTGRSRPVRALTERTLDVSLARPLAPGRVVLFQFPGSSEQGPSTLLARVERVVRHPNGHWVVRCRFACRARHEEMALALA